MKIIQWLTDRTVYILLLIVIAIVITGIIQGNANVPFSYCRGATYDVWKCKAERVDECIASEKFTRSECVMMVSK